MREPVPSRPASRGRLERRLTARTGPAPRWYRLYGECVRRLADHPATGPDAWGTPLAHGLGLEELVARLSPVFQHERTLLGWASARAALPHLSAHALGPDAVVGRTDLDEAMGLDWAGAGGDVEVLTLADPWPDELSDEQVHAAVGIAAVVLDRAELAAGGSHMLRRPSQDVPGRIVGDALALDTIAWCTTALLRLGALGDVAELLAAEPLPEPGWYEEPLWGGAERFWDGSDWTIWCRISDGRRTRQVAVALD